MPRIVYSKKRLHRPLIRTGPRGSGQFRETGWKEALEFVADRLEEIREHWQAESVLNLGGYGSCRGAMHNTALLTRRFLSLFGGFTDCSGNYSSGAESFVVPYLFGTRHAGRSGIDAQTLKHSRLILLWGANISDTRFGCEIENLVREQKKRGTPIIVIDPRRSRTVQRLGSQWIPIRPGSDTAFMAAVLYVLLSNGLIERDSLSRVCVGFDALEGYSRGAVDGQPKTPSWAEAICGTPRKAISDLAVKYGTTKPAALIPGLSIQRTIAGEEAIRMAVALQSATGNIGVPGGSSGTSIWNRLPVPRCGELPVPEVPGAPSVPVYRWSDAVLQGRGAEFSTDIRAIYNVGSNYLAMGSDIYKNIRAFERVDFSVCHDYFLTPTARYCDVVLPATTFLEREDVVFPETNHLLYSHQAIDPIGESRNDYDIFSELADRLGFVEDFTEGKSAAQWIDSFLAESEVVDIDEFRRRGIYTGAEQTRSGLSDFVADPINFALDTPSGKIELASRDYERLGVPPYPT